MLPPVRSLEAVEIACPCGGATPKQPIIGASGSAQPASAGSGCSSRTVPASRSISHSTRSRRGSSRAASGSTTFADSAPRVQPVLRAGSTFRISTLRASPGSAPSTNTGPFMGFGGLAFCSPRPSTPAASRVSVTTVAPLATLSTGGIAANTFDQDCGSRRCASAMVKPMPPPADRKHRCRRARTMRRH